MGTTSAAGVWSSRSGRVLPRLKGEGADGEENVRRGRRDRDLDPLVCGPVAQRGVGQLGRGSQDDPQVPGPGDRGGDGAGRSGVVAAGLGWPGAGLVSAAGRYAVAAGDVA